MIGNLYQLEAIPSGSWREEAEAVPWKGMENDEDRNHWKEGDTMAVDKSRIGWIWISHCFSSLFPAYFILNKKDNFCLILEDCVKLVDKQKAVEKINNLCQ